MKQSSWERWWSASIASGSGGSPAQRDRRPQGRGGEALAVERPPRRRLRRRRSRSPFSAARREEPEHVAAGERADQQRLRVRTWSRRRRTRAPRSWAATGRRAGPRGRGRRPPRRRPRTTPARWIVTATLRPPRACGTPSSSRASATVAARRPTSSAICRALPIRSPLERAHLAVRQVEVVLDPGADVAAEDQRGGEQLPLVAGDADHLPLVRALRAAGDLVRHQGDVARRRPDAAGDAHHQRDLQRRAVEQAHVDQRVEVGDVAGVEALVLGLDPELPHLGEELDDRVEAVLEDRLEDEVLAPRASTWRSSSSSC